MLDASCCWQREGWHVGGEQCAGEGDEIVGRLYDGLDSFAEEWEALKGKWAMLAQHRHCEHESQRAQSLQQVSWVLRKALLDARPLSLR